MKRILLLLLCIMLLLPSSVLNEETINEENIADEIELVSSEAKPLKAGNKGDEVRQLQTRLKDLRYYKAKVNGVYGSSTKAAVKAVQEAYGLSATGDADLSTLEIIYGDCHRPLKKGDEGKDIVRLQTRLSELGYYTSKISGSYLDATSAAVAAFQKDNGLDSNGKADIETQSKLYSDVVYIPTPDPNATMTPVPEPTPVPDLTFPGKLSYGSKSEGVKRVQERLKELGYFTHKSSAGFYKHTQAAVISFQKQNGLKASGTVDEETWNALYASDVALPKDPPKPSPEPTPVPYFMEVDVKNQLIKVFERDQSGAFNNLHRVFWCSTGTESYPSDIGTFTLTERRSRFAEFPNWGGGKARYWVKITPSIAFHSVIYSSLNPPVVSMKAVNKLGKRASHGCIRLTLNDAKWVYDHCGPGVEVWIHDDAQADPELKAAHKPGSFSKELMAHYVTPAPTEMPAYDRMNPPKDNIQALKAGAEGEDVFWLQSRLKELGHYTGTVTGQYREGTKAAVKKYQSANGLRASGDADKATLEMLYTQTLEEFSTATPLPTDEPFTPAPMPTPTIQTTQEPTATPGA